MRASVEIELAGLGVILYSPFALRHVREGEDYLSKRFWEPGDIAEHVRACLVAAFATGTPGTFRVDVYDGEIDADGLARAARTVRLGLEVREGALCIRDLYDLMDWSSACPPEQQLAVADGFYLITAYTWRPASGLLGDHQEIAVHLAKVADRPTIECRGAPDLVCG